MIFESIDKLAATDLADRNLKLGDYGLVAMTPDNMARALGYHTFTRAAYGVGIPYPSGRIGNIRLGQGHVGAKYNCVPAVTRDEVYWLGNKDAGQVLIIEGEFKAIACHQAMLAEELDLLIIGLPGAENWSGKSQRRPVHRSFEYLVRGKDAIVCVDYDGDDIELPEFKGTPKEGPLRAERTLLPTLEALGCRPSFVRIGLLGVQNESDRRNKYAIDDWVKGGGRLSTVLKRAEKYSVHDFKYVENKDNDIIDDAEEEVLNKWPLIEAIAYALASYGLYNGQFVRLEDGAMLAKADALLQWGGTLSRRFGKKKTNPLNAIGSNLKVAKIEQWGYDANEPFGYIGDGFFNLWKPWGPPVDGNVKPWLDLVEYVLGDQPEAMRFFHDWVAYLMQNPGKKNYTYIALVSPQGGVGKSLIAESVMQMMGPCGIELSGERLFSKNNELIVGKALIVINELSSDKSKHVNDLKAFVTSAQIQIEEKYKAARTVPNIANFIITSNSLAPTLVDKEGRRDAIIKIRTMSLADRDQVNIMAQAFVTWLKGDGAGIMRAWYLARDLEAYSPTARAPELSGRSLGVLASQSNAQMETEKVLRFVDHCTEVVGMPMVALHPNLILALCEGDRHQAYQVARELLKAPNLLHGSYDIMVNGKKDRYIMLGTELGGAYGSFADAVRATEKTAEEWQKG